MTNKSDKPQNANRRAIEKRRNQLRAGLSVRECSRRIWQYDRDERHGFSVRNRKTAARTLYAHGFDFVRHESLERIRP